MKKTSFFVLLISLSLLSSCGEKYKFKFNSPKKIGINKILELTVVEKNSKPIDSIRYFLDGIELNTNSANIEGKRLGKHAIKAVVYFDGREKQLNNTIYFLAAIAPKIYTYKIINTYPHDASAFTQGLEYYNGFIYESTGQRGESSIRKVALKTGKVLLKKEIDKKYFAEGLTIFDGKLYLLTWQSKKGFVYKLDDFSLIKEFPYGKSKEGWGFTHNSEVLIKSDGTERLWFLDPDTLKETHFIEAYTNTRKAERLNEIEFIKGKVYANVWQKSTILIIDPSNGTIEGIIDLRNLDKKVNKGSEDAVLNGIAYDKKTDRLFVTGKDWDKLFEIKIFEKQ